jgi:Malectin-like domain
LLGAVWHFKIFGDFIFFTGFLSIDCGLSGASSYNDSSNGLTYVSDENLIDTGVSSNISSSIMTQYGDTYFREYLTVRYFPSGTRNCYTIRSLTVGLNYLMRATFLYGNYDGKDKPPIFDIYLGVNFWHTVNATSESYPEIIFTAPADFVQVCLLNTSRGIPFISSLHLRQFNKSMYAYVNSSTSLILVRRNNLGGSSFVTRSVCKDIFNLLSQLELKYLTDSTALLPLSPPLIE